MGILALETAEEHSEGMLQVYQADSYGTDLTEATLMELMGDSRQAPHNEPYRQGSAAHRRGYPPIMRFSRAEKEGVCEMTSDPISRK